MALSIFGKFARVCFVMYIDMTEQPCDLKMMYD